MKIQISDRAFKQVEKIPSPHSQRLLKGITSLADNPLQGKQLTGKLSGYRSLRIGDYRIIYMIADNTIKIVVIGHRSHIYALIRRLLNFLFGL